MLAGLRGEGALTKIANRAKGTKVRSLRHASVSPCDEMIDMKDDGWIRGWRTPAKDAFETIAAHDEEPEAQGWLARCVLRSRAVC